MTHISEKRFRKRQYERMLTQIKQRQGDKPPENRFNNYICPAGHLTRTQDVDWGTTPMFLTNCCKSLCLEFGISTFYKDVAPKKPIDGEWYRPTLEDLNKKFDALTIDHVLAGGLIYRKV
jgi:hypothetical protein